MRELLWLVPALPLPRFGRSHAGVRTAFDPLRGRDRRVVRRGRGNHCLRNRRPVSCSTRQRAGSTSKRCGAGSMSGGFSAEIGLRLDPLSLVMMLVITGVGFLIHLFSTEFMEGEEGFGRFFAHLNLFVAAMLLLVLASDFLALYAGWEGVGLCSYLLIGFWWRDPANGLAARKAFIVTRIGDTALLIGLLLIATRLGTLDIAGAMKNAAQSWLLWVRRSPR